jgi:hypothetical protein
MKIVKILNAVALALIFSPFFQMCNDSDKFSLPAEVSEDIAGMDSLSGDTSTNKQPSQIDRAVDSTSLVPSDQTMSAVKDEKSFLEKAWEFITFPGDDSTGFGLTVITVVMIFERGSMSNIDWIPWLTTLSVILTIVCLIRVTLRRLNGLTYLYSANILVLIGAFASALNQLDHIHQIKWGFYAYFAIVLLTTLMSYMAQKNHTTTAV